MATSDITAKSYRSRGALRSAWTRAFTADPTSEFLQKYTTRWNPVTGTGQIILRSDARLCVAEGQHVRSTRHTAAECSEEKAEV